MAKLNFKTKTICKDYNVIEFISEKLGIGWNTACDLMVEQGVYPQDGEGTTVFYFPSNRDRSIFEIVAEEMAINNLTELVMIVD